MMGEGTMDKETPVPTKDKAYLALKKMGFSPFKASQIMLDWERRRKAAEFVVELALKQYSD